MPASTVSGVEIALLRPVMLTECDGVDAEFVGDHRRLNGRSDAASSTAN
jgi:hypothetical protein